MATSVSKSSGNFESNPMKAGINPAVITDAVIRDIPNFDDKTKMDRKLVTRYVNAVGQEASRFYTLSLNEKATLVKDLIGMGKYADYASIPDTLDDIESILVGSQCVVVSTLGTNSKGEKTAKITAVTEPMEGQNVKAPVKKGAAAPPATKQATRKAAAPPPPVEDGSEIGDDDIPF